MNFDSFAEIVNSARKVAIQIDSNNRMPHYRASVDLSKNYIETKSPVFIFPLFKAVR